MSVHTFDLSELGQVRQGLTDLADQYAAAGRDADGVRGALGSAEVVRAVDDFTDDWRRRRDKQVRMLIAAADALDVVCTSYVQMDCEGAATLRESGQGS